MSQPIKSHNLLLCIIRKRMYNLYNSLSPVFFRIRCWIRLSYFYYFVNLGPTAKVVQFWLFSVSKNHYSSRIYYNQLTLSLHFAVQLRNRSISGGQEPVLIHTEKSCIVSYYVQLSTNIKMYSHNIKTSFLSPCLRHLGDNKTDFNLIIVHFISAENCL